MPHAVGDVAGDVGVERGVLHLVADVVRVPRAVGALHRAQPLVRALGLVVAAADVERHRRLDQVPRVGVVARASTGCCRRAPGCAAMASTVSAICSRADHAGDLGEHGARHQRHLLRVDDEALAEHGVERAVDAAEPRGPVRDLPREEVVVACGRAGASALSTPTAHCSHQYGECSACAWCEPRSQQPGRLELLLELVLAVDADVAAGRSWYSVVERPAHALGPAGGHGDGHAAAGAQHAHELGDRGGRRPRCARAPPTR